MKTELVASDPFGVTFAPDGAYWVARSQTNDLLRLTPDGQTSELTGFAPSGGVGPRKLAPGSGRHPLGHARHAGEGRTGHRRRGTGHSERRTGDQARQEAGEEARGQGREEGQGEGQVQVLLDDRRRHVRVLAAAEGQEGEVQGLQVPGQVQAEARQVPVPGPGGSRGRGGRDPGEVRLQGGPQGPLTGRARVRGVSTGTSTRNPAKPGAGRGTPDTRRLSPS